MTAFDVSPTGIEKTKQLAAAAGVPIEAFVADINDYDLTQPFDVLFSTGVLQYVPAERRKALFANYRAYTSPGGSHVFSVFVKVPFIGPRLPTRKRPPTRRISGGLSTYYHDWRIPFCTEEVFDCLSSRRAAPARGQPDHRKQRDRLKRLRAETGGRA